MEDIIKYIEKNDLGEFETNYSLSKKTTYKTGGEVKLFVEPKDEECLKTLMKKIKKSKYNFFVLGNGSNVILPDQTSNIVVIKLNKLSNFDVGLNTITVGAGAMMPKLAHDTALLGISCFEFASGIPGTIGGGVYMNAGAYGEEFKDHLVSIKVLNVDTLNFEELSVDELEMGYRKSIIQKCNDKYVIVSATFEFEETNPNHVLDVIKSRRERRSETQPVAEACAGSVFKNFEDMSAWKVIETCGLRGYKIGGAKVSEKHCNMIINDGDATSKDIVDLINHIKDVVFEKTGRVMQVEQLIIDWD